MAYIDNNVPVIEKITLPSGNTYFIADREIRDVVDTLSQTVAGGVSYNVAWDGTSAPTVGNIPAGVVVTYQGTNYTGTMTANNATPGAFYLVKSATSVDGKDVYDEYVPVGPDGNKTWEKIGDTQIDLSDIITDVSLTKQTDSVIGADATFTITQPTISLSAENVTATGRVGVITELGTPTTSEVASSVTPTTKKLATTTVTGVQNSTTTASKATAGTAQTTATGAGTVSTTNTDWLKGVSVSNGVLTFGAATMNTQSTPQYTFSDVTVPIKNASATTVASGSTTTSGSGASVVTDVAVGDTVAAVTGYTPTTKYVAGSASGANTQWNSKDAVTVLKDTTDVNVTKG